jgi:hypothetical protein
MIGDENALTNFAGSRARAANAFAAPFSRPAALLTDCRK